MSSSPGPPQASGRRIRAGGGRDDSHRRGGGVMMGQDIWRGSSVHAGRSHVRGF